MLVWRWALWLDTFSRVCWDRSWWIRVPHIPMCPPRCWNSSMVTGMDMAIYHILCRWLAPAQWVHQLRGPPHWRHYCSTPRWLRLVALAPPPAPPVRHWPPLSQPQLWRSPVRWPAEVPRWLMPPYHRSCPRSAVRWAISATRWPQILRRQMHCSKISKRYLNLLRLGKSPCDTLYTAISNINKIPLTSISNPKI